MSDGNCHPANACGIDFGTSNSTFGWIRPGPDRLLALEGGKTTLPSVVFFNAEEESTSFGRAAIADYLEGHEGRLMRSLKSILGTKLIDGQTEVNGRALPFRELLRFFIATLKKRGEAAADRGFDQVTLGRPVHFIDDDPVADQVAEDTLASIARSVGFRDISFQFEPIAAAFDYESRIDREELVLIADIGGGTSDFSLLRLSPDRARKVDRRDDILANGGIHIGGTDFDKQLSLAAAMPQFGYRSQLKSGAPVPSSHYFNLATWHTINFVYTRQAIAEIQHLRRDAAVPELIDRLLRLIDTRSGHRLALEVEAAKIGLSDAAEVPLDLTAIEPELSASIERVDFETAVTPLVDAVGATVESVVKAAGIRPDEVDTLYFTGGGSAVPLLRQRIAAVLPDARAVEGDLYGSIGAGLAVDAQRRYS